MKILITGVAGFVGSNLANNLIKNGHTVTGIDNLSHGFIRNLDSVIKDPKFTFILGDLSNPMVLNTVKADIVVHLASQKIPRYTSSLCTLEENYLILRNIIQKCNRDKSKLVFSSTSDVYGKNTKLPFHEESDMVLGPTTVKRWAYASSKLVGEQLIMANHDEYGLEYTIMRFFGSYGPNQNTTWWGGPQAVFIQNILEGKSIEIHGDGTQTRTFTFIDDLVQGIVKCLFEEKSKNNIFNIASDKESEICIKDLGTTIWYLMNELESVPDIKFIPYATFGNYEDVLRRVADLTKIKTLLGYKPAFTLEEGLKITIEWQKELNKSPRLPNIQMKPILQ
jgi:UDP-glucose 4-epimerase